MWLHQRAQACIFLLLLLFHLCCFLIFRVFLVLLGVADLEYFTCIGVAILALGHRLNSIAAD